MAKPTELNFTVRYSPENEEWVATCAEFPSVRWLADTPMDALAGMSELAHQVLDDLDDKDNA